MDQSRATISVKAADMLRATEKQQDMATRDRRLVRAVPEMVLKADRILSSEDFPREVSATETVRK